MVRSYSDMKGAHMGKNRDLAMKKFDAFEKEMNDYAATLPAVDGKKSRTFKFGKQLRLDLIKKTKGPNSSVDFMLDSLRPKIMGMLEHPEFYVTLTSEGLLN